MTAGAPNPIARTALILVAGAALLGGAHALDAVVYERAFDESVRPGDPGDWYRLLRVAGYLPTWLLVGAALYLVDRARGPRAGAWRRGVAVVASAALAGGLAELVKLLVRRLRPSITEGAYAFRPFAEDTLSTSGVGMASSHAAVAFGAALALSRLHPPAAPVFLLVAAGCAWTRLLDRAHFLSDLAGAVCVAYGAVAIVWWIGRAIDARADARGGAPA